MRQLAFVLVVLRLHLASHMQYRDNFYLAFSSVVLAQTTSIGFISIVFLHFDTLGGWTQAEVIFLFGISGVIRSLSEVVFGNLQDVENMHLSGEIDQILTRPISPVLQIVLRKLPETALSNLVVGIGIIIASSSAGATSWDIWKTVLFGIYCFAAILIEGGIGLLLSGLSLRYISTQDLFQLKSLMQSEFGRYPLHIFDNVVQLGLTFVVPIAFTTYYPTLALLRDSQSLSIFLLFAPCLAAVITFGIGFRFWRYSLNYYQSVGS